MEECRLAFACQACKNVHEIMNISNKKGFEIVAFENVIEWSDFTNDLPLLEEKVWERSIEPPQKGALKKVQAHSNFNFALGEEFWTIFYPALSSFNGWEEHPNEIDSSALVKCRFESIISKNEEKAWINVRIEEIFPFSKICEKIIIRKGLINTDNFSCFRNYRLFNFQRWTLLSAGTEGDIGRWALVKKFNDQNIIIAYCEWDLYSNLVYLGNVLLTQDEMDELIKIFS